MCVCVCQNSTPLHQLFKPRPHISFNYGQTSGEGMTVEGKTTCPYLFSQLSTLCMSFSLKARTSGLNFTHPDFQPEKQRLIGVSARGSRFVRPTPEWSSQIRLKKRHWTTETSRVHGFRINGRHWSARSPEAANGHLFFLEFFGHRFFCRGRSPPCAGVAKRASTKAALRWPRHNLGAV